MRVSLPTGQHHKKYWPEKYYILVFKVGAQLGASTPLAPGGHICSTSG